MKDRRSSRLVDYDYTNADLPYNDQYSKGVFGKVENKTMALNELGLKVDEFIKEIPIHYPYSHHEVMPDHIHILMELKDR